MKLKDLGYPYEIWIQQLLAKQETTTFYDKRCFLGWFLKIYREES
jgi:hypothetical protein